MVDLNWLLKKHKCETFQNCLICLLLLTVTARTGVQKLSYNRHQFWCCSELEQSGFLENVKVHNNWNWNNTSERRVWHTFYIPSGRGHSAAHIQQWTIHFHQRYTASCIICSALNEQAHIWLANQVKGRVTDIHGGRSTRMARRWSEEWKNIVFIDFNSHSMSLLLISD